MIATNVSNITLDIPFVEHASCCFQSHFQFELLLFQVFHQDSQLLYQGCLKI